MTSGKALILGAGVGGLSAAYRLSKLSAQNGPFLEVTLAEASDRLGGVVKTDREQGFLLEAGPDCFISEKPAALELAKELGLEPELIGTNPHYRRSFLMRERRLRPIPEGFYLMAPSSWIPFARSDILSWSGKLRAAKEYFTPRGPALEDESLASFVERRFGREMLDYVAQPMISGIYGADPEALSLRATLPMFPDMEQKWGSVIRGLRRRKIRASGPRYSLFVSFKDGMQTLTDRLVGALPAESLLKGRKAVLIEKSGTEWNVTFNDGSALSASSLLLTLPAPRAAALLKGVAPRLSDLLSKIPYGSMWTLNLAYRREQIAHSLNGMGFVVPKIEQANLIACSFSSQKFEGRAPDHHVLLRAFLLPGPRSDIESAAVRELSELLGIRGDPLITRLSRYESVMPHYAVGHLRLVDEIDRECARYPGLFLAGNGLTGVGVPDTIARADRVARSCWTSSTLSP